MKTTIKDTNWRINFRYFRGAQINRMYPMGNNALMNAINVNLDSFRYTGLPIKLSRNTINRLQGITED